MRAVEEVYLFNPRPNTIQRLPEREVKSSEMYKRVKTMLKLTNTTRAVPLRLVEILSVDREIFNGVRENMIVLLRESRSPVAYPYNLTSFMKEGVDETIEVQLFPLRETSVRY